jgi:hypothetical protein
MKLIIGVVMCLAGVGLGLYCGLWWAFIGGIIQIIEQVRAEHLIAMEVAIGIVKILFAGLIGWASAAVLLIPGLAIIKTS